MQVQLDRHNGYIRISVHSVCQNLRIITTYVHAYVSCGDNSEPSFARDIASHIVLQMLLQLLNLRDYLLDKFFILYGLTAPVPGQSS